MSDTYTIELELDDETIPVELEEPGPLTKMELGIRCPDEDNRMSEEMLEFIPELVDAVSDFPADMLDDLPMSEFRHLTQSCSNVAIGEAPPKRGTDQYRADDDEPGLFDGLDLDDDGSVDPEDWR